MYSETVNATYETIANPILRLMLYGCAGIIAALATAVVFLYRERQILQREVISANFDAIGALNNVADAIQAVRHDIATIKAPQP